MGGFKKREVFTKIKKANNNKMQYRKETLRSLTLTGMAGDDAIEFFFLLVLIGLEEKVLQNIHLLSKDCWNKITKKFTIGNTAIKTTTKNKDIDTFLFIKFVYFAINDNETMNNYKAYKI